MRRSILLLTLFGCAPDAALFVPLPEMTSETALVAVAADQRVDFRASDTTGRMRFDLPSEGRARIAIAFFDETLDRMGLVEGPVASTDDTYARPLPGMVSGYVAEYVEGEVQPWTAVEAIDESLAGFKLPPRKDLAPNCAWQGRPSLTLGSTNFLRKTHTLDDGRLVVDFDTQVEVVETSFRSTTFDLPTNPYHYVVGTAGPSHLYLGTFDGALIRGTLSSTGAVSTEEVVAPGTSIDRFHRSYRLQNGHLLTTSGGDLYRLDDAGLALVASFGVRSEIFVAVAADGRAFVATERTIYFFDRFELLEQMTVDQEIGGLFFTGDGDLLIGLRATDTRHGRISRLDLAAKVKIDLHSTTREGDLSFMLDTPRGITYVSGYNAGGAVGAAYHFVPGYGPCEGALARFEESPTGLAQLGDGFVVLLGMFAPVEMIPFVPR